MSEPEILSRETVREPIREPAPQIAAPNRPGELPRALRGAMNGLRIALPWVQKVLPLLDGQLLAAVSNLLAPHIAAPPPADLKRLESSLADLRARHAELSSRLAEQNQALKHAADRLESQLDQVQSTVDRNTLELKELREGMQTIGRKANLIAIAALCLLALSVAANLFLFLHFQRILH